MRAFVVDHAAELGIADREVPEPQAAPGRAVVEVHASSLNRGEALHVHKYRLLPEGMVVGWDVAGVVVEQSTDGVGPPIGTPVFGWSDERGTWAERVSMRVSQLASMPPGLKMEDASTLGVAALTAYAAIGRAPRPLVGAKVIVTGATGGVGTFATQLALISGASVHAIVRKEADSDVVRAYVPEGAVVEHGFSADGQLGDLIVESVGGDTLSIAMRRVAPGGVVVSLGRTTDTDSTLPSGWFHKNAHLQGLGFSNDFAAPGEATAALELLGSLVVNGRLRTNISTVAPRDELPAVMRDLLERRALGKIVVSWR